MNVLVIAPHPDDEVIGCGGTIARLSEEGNDIFVVIVTKGTEPMFPTAGTIQCRKDALNAHKILGVRETLFLDQFPAALLDTVPHAELNAAIRKAIDDFKPSVLFIPFPGDIHLDHRLVFESSLVACRPNGKFTPEIVYAYETLSETNWNAPYLTPAFLPNIFIDIEKFLERKVTAFSAFTGEIKPFPNERSLEAIRALALHRGATVHLNAAEAFVLIRQIAEKSIPLF